MINKKNILVFMVTLFSIVIIITPQIVNAQQPVIPKLDNPVDRNIQFVKTYTELTSKCAKANLNGNDPFSMACKNYQIELDKVLVSFIANNLNTIFDISLLSPK